MIPAYSVAGLSLAPAAAGAPTDMSPGPVYAVTSATPAAVMLLPSSSLSQVVLTHQPLNVANLAAPVPTFLAGSMSMGVVWTPTPTAAMLGMGTPAWQVELVDGGATPPGTPLQVGQPFVLRHLPTSMLVCLQTGLAVGVAQLVLGVPVPPLLVATFALGPPPSGTTPRPWWVEVARGAFAVPPWWFPAPFPASAWGPAYKWCSSTGTVVPVGQPCPMPCPPGSTRCLTGCCPLPGPPPPPPRCHRRRGRGGAGVGGSR